MTEIDKSEAFSDDLLDKLTQVKAKLSDAKQQHSVLEDELLQKKAHLTELEDLRDEIHSQLAKLGTEIEEAEGKVGTDSVRLASLEDQLASLEASRKKNIKALTRSQGEIEKMRSCLFEINSELEEAEEYLRAGETREEHLTGELDKEREREERLKVEVIDVLSELAEVKNELARRRMADEAEERQAERGRQLWKMPRKSFSPSPELAYTTGCLEELNSQKTCCRKWRRSRNNWNMPGISWQGS